MAGNFWQTPEWFLACVRSVDKISLDPCTVPSNPVGARAFRTPDDAPDGLATDWSAASRGGLVYANIPFGRGEVARWVDKVIAEVDRGVELVLLTRGDTSTSWARRLIHEGRPELVCLPRRIRFRGAAGSPNFANLVFYFGRRPEAFARAFADVGPMLAPANSIHPTRESRGVESVNQAAK